MAVMFAKLYRALKDAGASDDVASAAAEEMASSLATMDAVGDLRGDLARFDSKIDARFASLDKDVTALKTDTAVLKWMVGFNLALTVALLGLFLRSLS